MARRLSAQLAHSAPWTVVLRWIVAALVSAGLDSPTARADSSAPTGPYGASALPVFAAPPSEMRWSGRTTSSSVHCCAVAQEVTCPATRSCSLGLAALAAGASPFAARYAAVLASEEASAIFKRAGSVLLAPGDHPR
jgi:hypothetical protein